MWLGMRVHYQITLLTRSNTLNRGPWGTVDLPSSGRPLGTGQSTPHLVTEPFLSRTPLQKCCNIFCPSSENIIRDVYLVDMWYTKKYKQENFLLCFDPDCHDLLQAHAQGRCSFSLFTQTKTDCCDTPPHHPPKHINKNFFIGRNCLQPSKIGIGVVWKLSENSLSKIKQQIKVNDYSFYFSWEENGLNKCLYLKCW